MLAGLIRHYVIKLRMIMRGAFGSEVTIPLIITCAEGETTCMQADVTIVDIYVVISMWPIAVIERERGVKLLC